MYTYIPNPTMLHISHITDQNFLQMNIKTHHFFDCCSLQCVLSASLRRTYACIAASSTCMYMSAYPVSTHVCVGGVSLWGSCGCVHNMHVLRRNASYSTKQLTYTPPKKKKHAWLTQQCLPFQKTISWSLGPRGFPAATSVQKQNDGFCTRWWLSLYWRFQNNWGLENSFQRFFVRVYYWETVGKQETDPQLFIIENDSTREALFYYKKMAVFVVFFKSWIGTQYTFW
jgi:hypothetical protein